MSRFGIKTGRTNPKRPKMRNQDRPEKKMATRQKPAGATSTGDGEPLPGAEKTEATTRQRPAGATSTGDGEPLPGAEKTEATRQTRPRLGRGRGATVLGRRSGITKAGGGKLPRC